MRKIEKLASGLQVSEVAWNLRAMPHFWNQFTARTESPTSPHHGLDDIWVRFGAPEDAATGAPHQAHWYPCADLLGVKNIVELVYEHVGGVELGGVLITRVPAGQSVKPHTDPGWHARYYEKYAVQIESAPGQKFCFEGAELESKPGDLYFFDNQYVHWVENPTPYERVTMIICIKRGE